MVVSLPLPSSLISQFIEGAAVVLASPAEEQKRKLWIKTVKRETATFAQPSHMIFKLLSGAITSLTGKMVCCGQLAHTLVHAVMSATMTTHLVKVL